MIDLSWNLNIQINTFHFQHYVCIVIIETVGLTDLMSIQSPKLLYILVIAHNQNIV